MALHVHFPMDNSGTNMIQHKIISKVFYGIIDEMHSLVCDKSCRTTKLGQDVFIHECGYYYFSINVQHLNFHPYGSIAYGH